MKQLSSPQCKCLAQSTSLSPRHQYWGWWRWHMHREADLATNLTEQLLTARTNMQHLKTPNCHCATCLSGTRPASEAKTLTSKALIQTSESSPASKVLAAWFGLIAQPSSPMLGHRPRRRKPHQTVPHTGATWESAKSPRPSQPSDHIPSLAEGNVVNLIAVSETMLVANICHGNMANMQNMLPILQNVPLDSPFSWQPSCFQFEQSFLPFDRPSANSPCHFPIQRIKF